MTRLPQFMEGRRPALAILVLLAAGSAPLARAADVGSGAPDDTSRQEFVRAFYRNGFSQKVSTPPLGDVKPLGTTGLVQEFQDAAKTPGIRFALVMPNKVAQPQADAVTIFHVYGDIYGYYSSLGVSTVGYPTADTTACPSLPSNSCNYQLFDKPYALFVYAAALPNGQNFSVRNPFLDAWKLKGGVANLGPPVDTERTATASSGNTATKQEYKYGAIYSITSGLYAGREPFAVGPPIYDLYVNNRAEAGMLGLPTSAEVTMAGGGRRQTFQGGAVEYDPGSSPALLMAVDKIQIGPTPASRTLNLKLGDAVTLQATLLAANGSVVSGRAVSWNTTNSRVATVQGSGEAATLRAVGGGAALVSATSEGKTSPAVTVLVSSPCCQVGEGAPTPAMEKTFENAVSRNRLQVATPSDSPVRRAGRGYIQYLAPADHRPGVRYLIALPDGFSMAFVVAGELLARYEQAGGPAGWLGYPMADSTPGGRQPFENASVLAGIPVRLVTGAILSKWAQLGYETGRAGAPVVESSPLLTFAGSSGAQQAFERGQILAATAGPRSGQVHFIDGLILVKYSALGGAGGPLGIPVSDEFVAGGVRRQEFEGGYVEYVPGETEAHEHLAERRPAVAAAPARAPMGAKVQIVISGFAAGSKLKVSYSGQPDFYIETATGAYVWESYVPLDAQPGVVRIRVTDVASGQAAEGSFTITTQAESGIRITRISGDNQSGAPASILAQPLRIHVSDRNGTPIAGAPVRFTASPGGRLTDGSQITDENGLAQLSLRLPPAEAVVLVTAEAAGQMTTFIERATALSLANFPRFLQSSSDLLGSGPATIAQKGSLLASTAAILRFCQNNRELAAANGLADPVLLNQFLTSWCFLDARGQQICDGYFSAPDSGEQVLNLWRLGAFAGSAVGVEVLEPEADVLRDSLSQGSPVLLALSLTADEAAAGSHWVVATGVAADGSVLIHDPHPDLNRTVLSQYLTGFTVGSQRWQGSLSQAVRLNPSASPQTGFLVWTVSRPAESARSQSFEVSSARGACGAGLEFPDAASFGVTPAASPRVSRFLYCEGDRSSYQLSVSGTPRYGLTVTDMAPPGSRLELSGTGAAAYRLSRPSAALVIVPQDVAFSPGSVVNAASFSAGIAPGGLFTIFGDGLAGPGAATEVRIDGVTVTVVAQSPFQINAQVPLDLAPGVYRLLVNSPYGQAEQPLEIRETAPAVFLLTGSWSGQGRAAIVNQDGRLNSPLHPARRGQTAVAYCTGLGGVVSRSGLPWARNLAVGVLDGRAVPVAYAGLTPGFIGLYQVNVPIPAAASPGLELPFQLRQGESESNMVRLSVE